MKLTSVEVTRWLKLGNQQLGFRHICVHCGSSNTQWIRGEWWLCHSCFEAFTIKQAMAKRWMQREVICPNCGRFLADDSGIFHCESCEIIYEKEKL